MHGQKSISQSLLDAINSAMSEDIHPQAQMLLKHIKPEHHKTYKPFLAKGTFNGSYKDRTDVLNAAKKAGHLVSENIEEIIEAWADMQKYVNDRNGPQPKGHIGQKAGTRYGGAGQKDDEREKETERLEKKKEMKKEDMEFKDRLIESLKGNQKKIDKNHNNKIDAQDFKILRAQKEEVEELDEVSLKTATSAYVARMGREDDKSPVKAVKTMNNIAKKHGVVGVARAAKAADKEYGLNDPVHNKRKDFVKGVMSGVKEEVELDEAGEIKTPSKGLTVDTLAGRTKAPKGFQKDNEHTSAKVPLKTEGVEDNSKEHEDAEADAKEDKAIIKRMVKKSALKNEETLEERDEGKPGLMFKKIAAKASTEYGSKEAGNRVAGAIRKKVLAKEGKHPESDTVPFVTDAPQSPKERLRAALGKVKTEMKKSW